MIPSWLAEAPEVIGWHHRDATPGETAPWPDWMPASAREALVAAGIDLPWRHQTELADLAFAGKHAAITTPTASGKTLAYLMPVLAARHGAVGASITSAARVLTRPRHTALYLAPTKALAHDQYRAALALAEPGWRVGTLDGDSHDDERRFARDYADYVLTNPDMLHHSVLPNHARWASFLSGLRYVIVDEAHRYRGTFGAHVAAVLRRLRRLCAHYGATPTFMLASATSPNAATFGGLLIGEPTVSIVSLSAAPRPALDIALWRPESSATQDAARLLAQLSDDRRQTIAFVASRALAELIAVRARERSGHGQIAAYRAGYLAADRRDLEAQLSAGALTAIAATNALELGVNISGLDAVIVHGFPGTLAALWQQLGRAGRQGRDALGIVIARDDPLDAYLFDHPNLLFDSDIEHHVLYPENPYVLGPHLAAAAQEVPLQPHDERWFGPMMPQLADHLVSQGLLRRRPAGWYWTRPDRATSFISLRSAQNHGVEIIDQTNGRVIGTVDDAASDKTLHPGAVYLHQGEQYVVAEYTPDDGCAVVTQNGAGYYTQPLSRLDVRILETTSERPLGRGALHTGNVRLTSQVVGFLRRDSENGRVWDQTPLDLPERTFTTQATWWTIPAEVIAAASLSAARIGSAAHAMEHCAIGLLPAFAPCDRWDIGGVSLALHPDTDMTTVFVHDGLPGGAGFAQRGYLVADAWLTATLQRLTDCACETGCPSCVVSPKCGNANQFLDRFAARELLAALLSE